nr:MAG TPA: hypothetical protein [Bacteriophage sp.]
MEDIRQNYKAGYSQSLDAHPRACGLHMHGTRRRETHGHAHARQWKRRCSKAAEYMQERGCVQYAPANI